MKKTIPGSRALTALALLAAPLFARGQDAVWTKITLTELHCMGCAKKIAGKVNAVPGVAEMRADVEARTLFVRHKPGMTPSPLKLWEAVEKADHTPTRMETPSGTHTSKPKS